MSTFTNPTGEVTEAEAEALRLYDQLGSRKAVAEALGQAEGGVSNKITTALRKTGRASEVGARSVGGTSAKRSSLTVPSDSPMAGVLAVYEQSATRLDDLNRAFEAVMAETEADDDLILTNEHDRLAGLVTDAMAALDSFETIMEAEDPDTIEAPDDDADDDTKAEYAEAVARWTTKTAFIEKARKAISARVERAEAEAEAREELAAEVETLRTMLIGAGAISTEVEAVTEAEAEAETEAVEVESVESGTVEPGDTETETTPTPRKRNRR